MSNLTNEIIQESLWENLNEAVEADYSFMMEVYEMKNNFYQFSPRKDKGFENFLEFICDEIFKRLEETCPNSIEDIKEMVLTLFKL